MERDIPVMIDPALNLDPARITEAWARDPDTSKLGRMETRPDTTQYPIGIVELVIVPYLVTIAAELMAEAIKRSIWKDDDAVVVSCQTLPDGREVIVVQKK